MNELVPPGARVSSCICSRRWDTLPSLRGEALDLVKIICPSRGECQGLEAGVGGLGSRVGQGYRGLSERKVGKGIVFDMYMKKISNKFLKFFLKSTSCSFRGPEFNSQQPCGGSQPSVMGYGALFWCV